MTRVSGADTGDTDRHKLSHLYSQSRVTQLHTHTHTHTHARTHSLTHTHTHTHARTKQTKLA